ncbi:hypothetical protein C3L33_02999, partial [Rhododendron williamsianum]
MEKAFDKLPYKVAHKTSLDMLLFMVPPALQGQIKDSTEDDLVSTGSAMLAFLRRLPEFKHSIKNFIDPERAFYKKNKKSALDLKKSGNDCFSRGAYPKALSLYSQALRVAPSSAEDGGKNVVAMLYLNRAVVLYNMGLLVECVRDCNRALAISPTYVKAWYRRAKANASLENYGDAVRDLHVAMIMEQSLDEKRKIENELKSLSQQQKDTRSSLDRPDENKSSGTDEPHQIKIECVSTPNKGKGMAAVSEIPKASLIHTEEPYAAVENIGKRIVISASMNYQQIWFHVHVVEDHYIALSNVKYKLEDRQQGLTQTVALLMRLLFPPDVVLAGRILVKSTEKKGHHSNVSKLIGTVGLSHNYEELPLERKLEFHIYSVAMIYCLQNSYWSEFPNNGEIVAKFVTLLSMISTNSMAIVRMTSPESVEQVKVGQAIYSAGSLFNHSCQPNIHAYFLSRTLYVRSTEYVAAGCPLEMSYGPQVGEWLWVSRIEFLKDKYAFVCRCRGCAEINLSDLVLSAFRCVKPNCFGVVLAKGTAFYTKFIIDHPPSSEPHMQPKDEEIHKVAGHLFELTGCSDQIKPGSCLRCGSGLDLDTSYATIEETGPWSKRLEYEVFHKELETDTLSDALRALDVLRSTLHPYNKAIAQLEDTIAHAFSMFGEFELALEHCKASIEILEKLYGPDHIAIGHELLKLASIQLAMGDPSAVEILDRAEAIFSLYYGCHANTIFPHLQCHKIQARELVQ